jgi:arginine deiminase
MVIEEKKSYRTINRTIVDFDKFTCFKNFVKTNNTRVFRINKQSGNFHKAILLLYQITKRVSNQQFEEFGLDSNEMMDGKDFEVF